MQQLAHVMYGSNACGVRNRMARFKQLHAAKRQGMAVFGDDQAVGYVITEDLLDNLRHFCAWLAGSNHDQAAANFNRLVAYRHDVLVKAKKLSDASRRIS